MLLLDEPTNDLDIETLNVLEDFLDGWPGTLVVVSHDRYFLERVTDSVWALLGDGQISMLPRGVDEYLERRPAKCRSWLREVSMLVVRRVTPRPTKSDTSTQPNRDTSCQVGIRRGAYGAQGPGPSRQAARAAGRAGGRAHARRSPTHASDPERLTELASELTALLEEKEAVELEWLEAAAVLE